MESGTTLTVAELPEPAFISPSETVMAHSPSQRPMTLAGCVGWRVSRGDGAALS